MVQSTPVSVTNDHLQKRDSEITTNTEWAFEKTVYCAANSLRNTTKILRGNLNLPLPPQMDININTEAILNATLDHFFKQCKNFTIAMTLKHQLQYLLFDTDSTPELSSKNTEWLFTLLTKLPLGYIEWCCPPSR